MRREKSCAANLRLATLFILPVLLAAAAMPVLATNFTVVTGPGLAFTPATLTIAAGDSVTFMNTSEGMHNVHADDNSFRCAAGCDGSGGNGDPSTTDWRFTLTFKNPGKVGYHCEIHGGPGVGMFGTIMVNAPNSGNPGTLAFTSGTYSVADTTGMSTIAVQRTGGSSGAVSVQYATSNGTGVSGVNYRAVAGTLNWADGDAANKTFNVPIVNDGMADGNHTVDLTLSAPSPGAAMGTSSAVLTITNTNNPAAPPAAPTDLTATPLDSTDVHLTWTLNSTDETDVHVQSKVLPGGTFADVLPLLPAGTNNLTVSGLQPATGYGFQVRTENASGNSAYTPEVDTTTPPPPGPCVAGANTLCLGDGGRFMVTVSFSSPTASGMGTAIALPTNPSSGLFYFFSSNNIEMLIKVLNACVAPFNAYWVFYAATTNVQFTVTVTDTVSGKSRVYNNALNTAAPPVQDTSAFLTCP
jgi:plastocyanin